MRQMPSNWSVGLLAFGFVLSLTAAACGDDSDDGGGSAGTGGSGGSSTGGKGGAGGSSTGGKGGSGGSSTGGKGGSGGSGGGASVADCKTETNKNASALPDGCSMCACEQDAKTVLSCDGPCWDLIFCAATKCADATGADAQTCAQDKCGTEISAALASGSVGSVQPVSAILKGATCGNTCSASDKDGGA